MILRPPLVLLALATFGCGAQPGGPFDAAHVTADAAEARFDAGHEPVDASDEPLDAGEEPADSGGGPIDAGEEPVDAGDEPVDAGEESVDAGEEPADAGEEPVDAGEADGGESCATSTFVAATVASPHVAACSVVTYTTEPPTSGPHYPTWAAFKTYAAPVPRGFWVHNLEHGGIVITHNCPEGCDADLARLQAFIAGLPTDPLCVAPVSRRIIVTPDPLSPTRFAAATWGRGLTSDCLDLFTLGAFLDGTSAFAAPENFCFDGTDVTGPDAGIPVNCGESTDGGM